ncbi:MAG: hypothetical protein FWG14_09945 [Peptococcaceae bacterium]|nr:hypothetical protein [Peptococcaceae bacterium]
MQLYDPIQILNLDNFLPLDGEDNIEIFTDGGVLNLDIFYEPKGSESHTAKFRISFPYTKYFFKTPFPDYGFFGCLIGLDSSPEEQDCSLDDQDLSLLHSLVEYRHSKILDMDHKMTGATGYRHYQLLLHSVGVAIHVIADSCEILGNIE